MLADNWVCWKMRVRLDYHLDRQWTQYAKQPWNGNCLSLARRLFSITMSCANGGGNRTIPIQHSRASKTICHNTGQGSVVRLYPKYQIIKTQMAAKMIRLVVCFEWIPTIHGSGV